MSDDLASAPPAVRQLSTPAALAVADLAAAFEDMQTVLRCCERLVSELGAPPPLRDELVIEAFWTTALLSYARCFAPGSRGMGLTAADVTDGSGLQGDVGAWHAVLLELAAHYGHDATNPREEFSVGVAQGSEGQPVGVAVTGHRTEAVDELTVRQTGAVAFALSTLLDQRIAAQQEVVFGVLSALSPADLEALPLLDVEIPDPPAEPPGGPPGASGQPPSSNGGGDPNLS